MRTLLIALLLCLAFPGVARAERALTLDQALALARDANRDLTAARERLVQADADVSSAWARLLPSLSAQGRWLHNDVEVSFPLSGQNLTIQPLNQLTGTVNASIPLLVPAAIPAVASVKHAREAVAATLEATTGDILLSVAQAFYAAAGTDELVAARREGTALTEQTLRDAKARLSAGAAGPVDVTRAELSVTQAQQAVTEAEDSRARAYRGLATLLLLREPFVVAPGSSEVSAPGTTEALVAAALDRRPELRAAREAALARDSQLSAIDWQWAPSLSAFANATTNNAAGLTGRQSSWSAGLQLDWSLFDGGVRLADRRRSASQQRDADLQVLKTRDAISDEVADRVGAVQTRRSALATALRGEGLAKEALEVVRTQYAAGTAAQVELLQAQDALIGARVQLAQARFDAAISDLSLRRSAGVYPAAR